MLDYTYNGTPVSKMNLEDISRCIAEGVQIRDSEGLSNEEAHSRVMQRLQLELDIRRLATV